MRRRKESLWIQLLFLTGIGLGTAVGVWLRNWLAEQITVYHALFFMQMSQSGIPDWSYFFYLLRVRGSQTGILMLAVFSGWYIKVILPVCFVTGFWCGVLVAGVTFLDGIAGIVVFAVNLLPHFLLYGFGCLLLYEFACKKEHFRPAEQVRIILQIAAVFGVGAACECWIQPVLIRTAEKLLGVR